MPSVSDKQHRAMEAAAHGKSKIGIPKKVGKEFAAADDKKGKKKHRSVGDILYPKMKSSEAY